jgi:NitT/TauT family transport system substrate-binding protein
MSTQHARQFSRRRFLKGLTLMGTAGLLGLRPAPVVAEPPPETTKIKLYKYESICIAPQYVAEELLRGEGFTEVQYVEAGAGAGLDKALASGEATSASTSSRV